MRWWHREERSISIYREEDYREKINLAEGVTVPQRRDAIRGNCRCPLLKRGILPA